MNEIARYYDVLIEHGNDPVLDGPELSEYMDLWDGEKFVDLLSLDTDKAVLEIGCGTGRIAKKLLGRCRTYTGIDLSPKSVAAARGHFSDGVFLHGDFLTYEFGKKYDVILSTLTWMHVADKIGALIRVFDLLAHDGIFVLSIDKNQQTEIDAGYCRISVYPDDPELTLAALRKVGFANIVAVKTEHAHIFRAGKP